MKLVQGYGLRHSGLTLDRSRGYDPRKSGVSGFTDDLANSIKAAEAASRGGLSRLNFDSWSSEMVKLGYDRGEIAGIRDTVLTLMPSKYKNLITKRAPVAKEQPPMGPYKQPGSYVRASHGVAIPWAWIGTGAAALALGAVYLARRA